MRCIDSARALERDYLSIPTQCNIHTYSQASWAGKANKQSLAEEMAEEMAERVVQENRSDDPEGYLVPVTLIDPACPPACLPSGSAATRQAQQEDSLQVECSEGLAKHSDHGLACSSLLLDKVSRGAHRFPTGRFS